MTRRLAAIKKKRKFNGKVYDLDYIGSPGHMDEFAKRVKKVRARGSKTRIIRKKYKDFGTYKALYVRD